jgi:hypothetical protein
MMNSRLGMGFAYLRASRVWWGSAWRGLEALRLLNFRFATVLISSNKIPFYQFIQTRPYQMMEKSRIFPDPAEGSGALPDG